MQTWTFFTNHTHVLVYLALHGDAPLREVAAAIGITERAVQRIVRELEESGVLKYKKVGRCNHYSLNKQVALRHPLEKHCKIGQILDVILKGV
jgi:DNA-binding Lrp family transcriptional regulator